MTFSAPQELSRRLNLLSVDGPSANCQVRLGLRGGAGGGWQAGQSVFLVDVFHPFLPNEVNAGDLQEFQCLQETLIDDRQRFLPHKKAFYDENTHCGLPQKIGLFPCTDRFCSKKID